MKWCMRIIVSKPTQQIMIHTFSKISSQVKKCNVSYIVANVNNNPPCGGCHHHQEPWSSGRITWEEGDVGSVFWLVDHHAPWVYSWGYYGEQQAVKGGIYSSTGGNLPEASQNMGIWRLANPAWQCYGTLVATCVAATCKCSTVTLPHPMYPLWSNTTWYLPLFTNEGPSEVLSLQGCSRGSSKTVLQEDLHSGF